MSIKGLKKSLAIFLTIMVVLQTFLSGIVVSAAGENSVSDAASVKLIDKGSFWSYSDEGLDYGYAMKGSFDFSNWKAGAAPFGYKVTGGVTTGDVAPQTDFGKVSTVLSFGGNDKKKHITTYFSKTVPISDTGAYESYKATLGVDDGIVLYANGIEVYRAGMSVTEATYTTYATSNKTDPVVYKEDLSVNLKAALKNGDNVITAEIHNSTDSSSDLYFDMELTAALKQSGSCGTGNGPGTGAADGKNIVLLPPNAAWKYLDNGTDQATAWRGEQFADSSWSVQAGPFGYPAGKATDAFGSVKQPISYGNNASMKYRTSYFRTTIDVKNLVDYKKIAGTFGMDDGAVLYVNGKEVYRFNMPEGEPNFQTLSSTTINEPATETVDLTSALNGVLHNGINVLAAEVHQRSDSSSDLYWDMKLVANPDETPSGGGGIKGPVVPTAIALTFNGDPKTSQGFGWYTDPSITGTKLEVAESAKVVNGTFPAGDARTFEGTALPVSVYQSSSDKNSGKFTTYASHKVTATGLKAGTDYSYRIGDGQDGHWSDIRSFTTGGAGNAFTFLYTTDPQGTTESEYVTWKHTLEEALGKFPASKFVTITGDLVDNGDIENQWMWLLNQPKEIFSKLPIVPALGNHESKANNNFTYHFNVPNTSNTEAKPDGSVYAFDYGPAHFMVMNTEYNEAKGIDTVYKKQEEWLRAEAAKTDKKWKIVMFHKSPYSVANHTNDSDVLFFRKKLTALFDELGIDVVLSGHDHTYTRTYPMFDNVPEKTSTNENNQIINPKGTLYLVSNAAGDKRYTPKAGPFPFAAKYGQPGKEMFTGITVEDNSMSFQVYTTTEKGSTDLYDQFSIQKTDAKPNPVRDARMSTIQNGQSTLTWNAPQGGPEPEAYRIYEKNDQMGANWNARVVPAGGSATYALANLDPSKTYRFAIKAVSGKNSSDEVIAAYGNSGGGNGGDGGGSGGGGNNSDNGNTGGAGNGNSGSGSSNGNSGSNNGNTGNTGNSGNNGNPNTGGGEIAPKPQVELTDIKDHWAYSVITQAVEKGFIAGYEDGSFKPDKQINRVEMVSMLVKALRLKGAGASLTFTDADLVPDWAQSYVSQAVSAGLIDGFSDNTLRPNQSLSRLELVTLIVRASKIAVDPKAEPTFSDADKIPSWGAPYVAAAAKAGLIQGRDNNEFEPMATATRAESATTILSLLKHLKI
ncbi:S-layer homology domain-containing protein [Paenibacillus sp. GbtcB18]|uniref:S-layer homology domain-containing protein n=1 Tax=Paenibacillus sp. GbtcB18 TaxID=2824763 RepID=UPI001C3113EA|nr:S-layer homology domain-containing protein [Paenibacillus sp. GbtcB18]